MGAGGGTNRAPRFALRRDERVFLMGEDLGRYGGAYVVGRGLLEEFGPERVRDTPLSETAFVGAGIGAALGGMRPIVAMARGAAEISSTITKASTGTGRFAAISARGASRASTPGKRVPLRREGGRSRREAGRPLR